MSKKKNNYTDLKHHMHVKIDEQKESPKYTHSSMLRTFSSLN